MEEKESKILEEYVLKMLEVQKVQTEKPLSLQELQEIAYSVGMTEQDWRASQEVLKVHLRNGEAHMSNQNWMDAIGELKQVVALNPYHELGLYNLALAHYQLFVKTKTNSHKLAAQDYIERALKNEEMSHNNAALQLMAKLRAAETGIQTAKKQWFVRITAIVGIVVLVFLLLYYTATSSLTAKQEAVKAKKVQLENVIQRRDNLLPEIENMLKTAQGIDPAVFEKMDKMQKSLQAGNQNDYLNELRSVKTILEDLSNLNETDKSKILREQIVQIEGAENRINVEAKKYNDLVEAYNQRINSFPQNLFGFQKLDYYKRN